MARARWRWRLCLAAQMTLPFPRIEEGHNVFLIDAPAARWKPDCRRRPFA